MRRIGERSDKRDIRFSPYQRFVLPDAVRQDLSQYREQHPTFIFTCVEITPSR
jgi:hypothetical protein